MMKKKWVNYIGMLGVTLLIVIGISSIALGVGMDDFGGSAVSPIIVVSDETVHIKVTFRAYGWAADRVWPTFIIPDGKVIYFYDIPNWPEVCELQYTGGDHATRPRYPSSHGALTIWERDIPVATLFKLYGPGVYQIKALVKWEPQNGKKAPDEHTQVIGEFKLVTVADIKKHADRDSGPVSVSGIRQRASVLGPRQAEDKDEDAVICLLHFNEGEGLKASDDDSLNPARNSDALFKNGPSWVEGKFGKGILFDGVDDYLEIPDSPYLESKDGILTVETYIKPTTQTGDITLVSRTCKEEGGETTGWSFWYFAPGGGTAILEFAAWRKGEVIMNVGAKTKFSEGQWYDVAGVTDGAVGRVYVNGELVGYGEMSPRGFLDMPASIVIGQKYKGAIDEVYISRKVREKFAMSADLPVRDLNAGRPTEEYGRPGYVIDWEKVKVEKISSHWFGEGKYKIDVSVLSDEKGEIPAYVDIDFERVLHRLGIGESVGGVSVEVYEHNKGSGVPFKVDELSHGKGRVRWLADTRESSKYSIYFDMNRTGGIGPKSGTKPCLIGDGDEFRKKEKQIGSLVTMATGADIFDWDKDGDLDLITTHFGFPPNPHQGVSVYKNIKDDPIHPLFDKGTPLRDAQGRYLYLGGIRNGYWLVADAKFIDWDGDGDRDIVSFGCEGKFYYYENKGDDLKPAYVENTAKFKQLNGKPFTGDYIGGWYFDVLDWDNDGDYDFLYHYREGLKLYENVGSNDYAVIKPGGYVEVSGKPISGVHSFTITDWDEDGKFDLIIALSGTESSRQVVFVKNESSLESPMFKDVVPIKSDGTDLKGPYHTRPIIVDWSHDGKKDLIITSQFNNDIYLNIGEKTKPVLTKAGSFETEVDSISVGFCASPAIADWDGDGDYDIISGNSEGFIYYFENRGDNSNPFFAESIKITADGKEIDLFGCTDPGEWESGHSKPIVVDWDGDGDMDLIVGDHPCQAHFYENIGTRSNPEFLTDQLLQVNGGPLNFNAGRRVRPAVVDWDNDGDLDLVCASEGYLKFFERVGKIDLKPGVNVRYSDGSPIQLEQRSTVVTADWDRDGKKDLIIYEGVQNQSLWNWLDFYKNNGDGVRHVFQKAEKLRYPLISAHESGFDIIDWNGDGDLDVIIGTGDGGYFCFFEHTYFTPPRITVDSITVKTKE